MASKVISCRVVNDIAEEFERVCAEKHISPSDMLKKLVDDMLYPSSRRGDESIAHLTAEQVPDEIYNRLEKLERFTGAKEASELDRLLGTDKSITEQVVDLSRQLKELSDQFNNKLSELDKQEAQLDRASEAADVITELKESHNELVRVINENAQEVKRIIPIVEAKLEGIIDDLDLLYQATDDHKHSLLEMRKITGNAYLKSSTMAKRFNERVALAQKRQPISKG